MTRGRVVWCREEYQIARCEPLLAQLVGRTSICNFVSRVNKQGAQGYRLVALEVADKFVTVAGFKIVETLSWGRILFIDDLVTDEPYRGCGFGKEMFSWLRRHGQENSCREIHLDSSVDRGSAHGFYERLGMVVNCHHFAMALDAE